MQPTINCKPTLFLFLGTTAGQIGWRVKKMFKEAYGIDIPVHKFLWFDTNQSLNIEQKEWFTDDEKVFLRGDFFKLTTIVKNLDMFPQIKDWWPRNINPGKLGPSEGSRLTGRLLLFHLLIDQQSKGSIKSRLTDACNSINSIAEQAKVHTLSNESFRFDVADGTDVVMVFSPCGGTGSAISFDLAYLCRDLLPGATIYTYEPLPEVVDAGMKGGLELQKSKSRANVYAWFKEDNYLAEEIYWKVRYQSMPDYIEKATQPFDFRFLVDIKNQSGKRLSTQEEVFETIAKSIFIKSETDLRSMLDHMRWSPSVLDTYFPENHGRLRMYSSLVVTSLVFPKDRVINYCTHRFSNILIDLGLLATPSESETNAATSNLLTALNLRDNQLIDLLKKDSSIPLEYCQMINHTADIAEAIELFSTQKAKADAIFEEKIYQLDKVFIDFKEKTKANIEQSVVNLACNSGLTRAVSVLELLQKSEDDLSLIHFQNTIQGNIGELPDSQQLEKAFKVALKNLVKLQDGNDDGLTDFFSGQKAWNHILTQIKNACFMSLEELYKQKMLRCVIQKAIDVYTELISFTSDLLKKMEQIIAETKDISTRNATELKSLLETTKQKKDDNFHITREIEVDLERYYQGCLKNKLDPSAIVSSIIPDFAQSEIKIFYEWMLKDLEKALTSYGNQYFSSIMANITALEALKWLADSRGENPNKMIQAEIDDLLKYCRPLIKIEKGMGLDNFTESNIISISASPEELDSFPVKYRNNLHYNFIDTGFRERIDILKEIHGIPAYAIEGMSSYKVFYNNWLNSYKSKQDPLHVLPDMDLAPDIFPEDDKEVWTREIFLKGLVFDCIVDVNNNYYYDPDMLITIQHVIPPSYQYLGKGWDNAINSIIRKPDWLDKLEVKFQDETIKQGKDNIIQLIQVRIDRAYETMRSINSPNSKTVLQLNGAIDFWKNWQITLY
jgi:6-pyruvoyl-tetrahydropterin synthase